MRELVDGAVTSAVRDTICAHVAGTFAPAMLTLSDAAVNRLARRGGWKIGVGYRTWISNEVGSVDHAADGLTFTSVAGGNMLSTPDDCSAEQVVAAMTETLTRNSLDEIPH
ncbi:hypothetical protein BVC93_11450 [Mycobacterium sp. MS1601]|nr:hypothetical protein BVC93_11450 [Mycobacterium sp. MS1601]